nr:MAG TPA: hypothetical protein [Caudoviricetes sp.]
MLNLPAGRQPPQSGGGIGGTNGSSMLELTKKGGGRSRTVKQTCLTMTKRTTAAPGLGPNHVRLLRVTRDSGAV